MNEQVREHQKVKPILQLKQTTKKTAEAKEIKSDWIISLKRRFDGDRWHFNWDDFSIVRIFQFEFKYIEDAFNS